MQSIKQECAAHPGQAYVLWHIYIIAACSLLCLLGQLLIAIPLRPTVVR